MAIAMTATTIGIVNHGIVNVEMEVFVNHYQYLLVASPGRNSYTSTSMIRYTLDCVIFVFGFSQEASNFLSRSSSVI